MNPFIILIDKVLFLSFERQVLRMAMSTPLEQKRHGACGSNLYAPQSLEQLRYVKQAFFSKSSAFVMWRACKKPLKDQGYSLVA